LPISEQAMGVSLLDLVAGRDGRQRRLFGEAWARVPCVGPDGERMPFEPPGFLLQTGSLKLSRYRRNGGYEYELYDVEADAAERQNRFGAGGAEVDALKAALDAYQADCKARAAALRGRAQAGDDAPAMHLDERQREKLRALGYID
jgi:hypothetical protein